MIFFTADTHFNHKNVIRYCGRPFADLDEMTERLITNWNDTVRVGDTVYHLGDFALSFGKKHEKAVDDVLRRLNGRKILICGNHDRKEVKQNPRWNDVRDYLELKLDLGGIHKQRIVLFHYGMRVWNQRHRGAWHLYGHSHGTLSDIGGKCKDVGVDCNNYKPLSLFEIQTFMSSRESFPVDHHGADAQL